MNGAAAIHLASLEHHYGRRCALRDISFDVAAGEIFALLGPNGSGKTTLFRLLSTLLAPQRGEVAIFGAALPGQAKIARHHIGVVFQAPSIDRKLTVRENLRYHAALYGIARREADRAAEPLLEQLGLTDRADERTETLSGGLRRRVELAQTLLHEPRLLLLDEPATGLDPGARRDLWTCLLRLRDERGVTIALTTHLLDDAESADRIAILDQGHLVALDTPDALRAELGGDVIDLETDEPDRLARDIIEKFDCPAEVLDGVVRVEHVDGHRFVAELASSLAGRFRRVTIGTPTLEDVFVHKTGHRFWADPPEGSP